MGRPNEATGDDLHGELCAAIADLAKSVDIAVTRMALRAKCSAAIADASKAERAAELLRAVVMSSPKVEGQEEVTLVPLLATTSRERSSETNGVLEHDAAHELYSACQWLTAAQVPRTVSPNQGYRGESKIAMRILELQDRLAGLTNR